MIDALCISKYLFICMEQYQHFLHTLASRFLLPNAGTSLSFRAFFDPSQPWTPGNGAEDPSLCAMPPSHSSVELWGLFRGSASSAGHYPCPSDRPATNRLTVEDGCAAPFPEWENWWTERILCKQLSMCLDASLVLCLVIHVKQHE